MENVQALLQTWVSFIKGYVYLLVCINTRKRVRVGHLAFQPPFWAYPGVRYEQALCKSPCELAPTDLMVKALLESAESLLMGLCLCMK